MVFFQQIFIKKSDKITKLIELFQNVFCYSSHSFSHTHSHRWFQMSFMKCDSIKEITRFSEREENHSVSNVNASPVCPWIDHAKHTTQSTQLSIIRMSLIWPTPEIQKTTKPKSHIETLRRIATTIFKRITSKLQFLEPNWQLAQSAEHQSLHSHIKHTFFRLQHLHFSFSFTCVNEIYTQEIHTIRATFHDALGVCVFCNFLSIINKLH